MKSSRNITVSIVVVIAIARDWLNGPVIQRRMFLRTQTANRTSLRQRRELRMANRIFQVFGNSVAEDLAAPADVESDSRPPPLLPARRTEESKHC